jgi:hypothetical protein
MRRPLTIPRVIHSTALIGLIVVLAMACGGCALVPLSTVFGIAGTAASTGPEVYSYGKLDIAFMAEDGIVQKAVREAAADLGLRMIRDCRVSQSKKIWNFVMQDDLNLKIGVTVEQRAAKLCLCQVDVGLLGSEPTARLVMTRIKAHLPSSAAAPAGA